MTYEEAYNSMADWQRSQLEAMKEELADTQMLARMQIIWKPCILIENVK